MFNRELKERVEKLEYNSHPYVPEPVISIPLKTPHKGDNKMRPVNGGVSWFIDSDRTEQIVYLKEAVKLLIDHLKLKYEDGSEIKPRLVK